MSTGERRPTVSPFNLCLFFIFFFPLKFLINMEGVIIHVSKRLFNTMKNKYLQNTLKTSISFMVNKLVLFSHSMCHRPCSKRKIYYNNDNICFELYIFSLKNAYDSVDFHSVNMLLVVMSFSFFFFSLLQNYFSQ